MKTRGGTVRLGLLALALVCLSPCVVAEGADGARRLAEQKLRLLEMLLASPSAKADAGGLGERGARALAQAKEALASGQFDEASRAVDEILRSSASQAARRTGGDAPLADSALRLAHQNLIEQVATYRASVEDLLADPRLSSAARGLLVRIDAHTAEARKEAGSGRLSEANRILGDAYRLAVGELSRLRSGQEVVLSLNFASPADEYAYEIKRYESGEMMVGMMRGEGRAEGERRVLVEDYAAQARSLRNDAEAQARAGRHREAVSTMEKATALLNRALQSMGVPVF